MVVVQENSALGRQTPIHNKHGDHLSLQGFSAAPA